jgi:hypothetical protein
VIDFDDADERPHAPGPTSAWSETWEWRLTVDDASLAVVAVLVRRPFESRMSYICAVLGRGRDTVAVVEHEIALPRRESLELRASGIWADHVCEAPFSHWSLGLEAFGLTVDDPDDALGAGRGIRTPVGLDVEWEDASPPRTLTTADGYLATGRAHGEVLVGVEHHDVVGTGHRLHRWGTGPRLTPWTGSAGRAIDGLDASTGLVVGRAAADDATGAVTDWVLRTGPNEAPSSPLLSSRSRDSEPGLA